MPRTNVAGTTAPSGSGAQRSAQAGEREHRTDSTARPAIATATGARRRHRPADAIQRAVFLADAMVPEPVSVDDDKAVDDDDGVIADDPWADPGCREAALDYHKARDGRASIVSHDPDHLARLRRLLPREVSIERAWHELNDVRNRSTPKATIDAVWWAICERGMGALAEPRIADRIANFDEAARSELDRRIANIGV